MGRKVAYGRVSSREQAENQHAAEQQRDRLKSEDIEALFFDIESGDSATRPEFNRMLKQIQLGEISIVIATRWDRLTRNEEVYLNLKMTLQVFQVRLILLDQGEVDLASASGELSADMQAIFAVHERRMLRERILRGHAYRRKRKVAWTRAPFGYVIEDDRYFLDKRSILCRLSDRPQNYLDLYRKPDTSTALVGLSRYDIALEAIDLLKAIHRPRRVLTELYRRYGVECKAFVEVKEVNPQDETVRWRKKRTNLALTDEFLLWSAGGNLVDWVNNPVLRGHTAYRKYRSKGGMKPPEEWEMHYDTHPDQRLLSDADFEEIQVILRANRRKVGTPGSKFALTGLVVCDHCGHKMEMKRSPHYRYYGCSQVSCPQRKCIRVERLEEAIANTLFQRAHQLASEQEQRDGQTSEPRELQSLRQQLADLDQLVARGGSEALKRARHDLLREIEQMQSEARLLNLEKATAQQILSHPIAQDLGFWHTRTYAEREQLYDKLLHRVRVLDGEVVAVELTV